MSEITKQIAIITEAIRVLTRRSNRPLEDIAKLQDRLADLTNPGRREATVPEIPCEECPLRERCYFHRDGYRIRDCTGIIEERS